MILGVAKNRASKYRPNPTHYLRDGTILGVEGNEMSITICSKPVTFFTYVEDNIEATCKACVAIHKRERK